MISEFQGEHRWLSNFSPVVIIYMGMEFPSVENAFQASKCKHNVDVAGFQGIGPGAAKRLGRQVVTRDYWEDVKDSVMLDLTILKYENIQYRERLLATGDAELVEGNWWGDTYWGVCKGVGQNKLGKIIMRVREGLIDD